MRHVYLFSLNVLYYGILILKKITFLQMKRTKNISDNIKIEDINLKI